MSSGESGFCSLAHRCVRMRFITSGELQLLSEQESCRKQGSLLTKELREMRASTGEARNPNPIGLGFRV